MSPPPLSLRIGLAQGRFGPGKARLLALIGEHGSIMQMAYRRAGRLGDEVNAMRPHKLGAARAGGARGGGAELTEHGRLILQAYDRLMAETAQSPAMKGFAELFDAA